MKQIHDLDNFFIQFVIWLLFLFCFFVFFFFFTIVSALMQKNSPIIQDPSQCHAVHEVQDPFPDSKFDSSRLSQLMASANQSPRGHLAPKLPDLHRKVRHDQGKAAANQWNQEVQHAERSNVGQS